ncbi:MAG: hypothetical protein ACM336_06490 [Acidobacteriota bacterium]
MKLHTYLNYGGNCEQAFRFYEQHLGGKITALQYHGETFFAFRFAMLRDKFGTSWMILHER